jgi:hypothetical protein
MALWDSADLLLRAQEEAYRPSVDQEMTVSRWYRLLTEAQNHWLTMLATHAPESQYGPSTVLVTKDAGFSYLFPDANVTAAWASAKAYTVGQKIYETVSDTIQMCTVAGTSAGAAPTWNTLETGTTVDNTITWTNMGSRFVFPLGDVEVRAFANGRLLRPGVDWDPACDYVPAGNLIRFPNSRARTYGTGGPVARYVPPARVIDANTQPIIQPGGARILLVHHACMLWAAKGALRDPTYFENLLKMAWAGNPDIPGDLGWVGALKLQFLFAGAAAFPAGSSIDNWWRFIDDGSGYSAQVP